MRTLVIEDDSPLAEFLEQRLRDDHFTVDIAGDGEEGQRLAENSAYDLVILDLALPRIHGLDVLRHIRVGSNGIDDRVKGLDAGADDYLAKPFSYAELSARMRALLRRSGGSTKIVLKVDDLELDRFARTVRRGSCGIELTPKEFALLEFLMQRPRQPVTRLMISELAWKLESDTMTNVVDVYINYLRRKIDSGYERRLIRTVRGVGYQIGAP